MHTRVIGIVGGGTMGRGLAHLAVQNGFGCVVLNRSAETGEATAVAVQKGLEGAVKRGKLSADEAETARGRLLTVTSLDEVMKAADFVIEALPEDLELKTAAFAEMGRLAPPETILATNTSSLPVTALAKASGIPGRVLGTHFFHPPVQMKLLEMVVPETTSVRVVNETRAVGEALGRTVIRVKDSPGFATSRLSVAVGLEALRMLEEGVASAEDIDTAMEVGYRWPMGPLKLGDWVGLDVRLAVADELYGKLGSETFCAPKLLRDLVGEGRLGRKSGQGVHRWDV